MDLQGAEEQLAKASEEKNSAIVQLVQRLNDAIVYSSSDNEVTNRKLCVLLR